MTTYDTLSAFYRNVQRLGANTPLPTDAAAQLKMMADGVDAARAGQVGFGWTLDSALAQISGTVDATTSVASMAYGFITGSSLTAGGLDYLVSPTGGNPNNLNSDYYKAFSLENRYINFAVNLAKFGEGKAMFAAEYGDGSIFQTFVQAYQKLFNVTKTQADAFDLLAAAVPDGHGGTYTRGEYFAAIGQDGGNGVGTKAAMIGWLLAEAVKADAGPYAAANANFLRDVAGDGFTHQTADFLGSYRPGGPYAPGGTDDPGLPGERAKFEHDWNVGVAKDGPNSDIHALATDGNDVLSSPAGVDTGLDVGRTVFAGGGNDIIAVNNGLMQGHIDAGSGNDTVIVFKLDGQITTGTGHDVIEIEGFGPLHNNGFVPGVIPAAIITDFAKGFDNVEFTGDLGAGAKVDLVLPAVIGIKLDDVLTYVSSVTAANKNSVFEWNGDTYVYHQNDKAGLDMADGLV
ncbi:MAG: hypothetical protein JWP92_734, partial [Caulobacter sp.]|nr:hypothetical protein [Caulobacter sp.]